MFDKVDFNQKRAALPPFHRQVPIPPVQRLAAARYLSRLVSPGVVPTHMPFVQQPDPVPTYLATNSKSWLSTVWPPFTIL